MDFFSALPDPATHPSVPHDDRNAPSIDPFAEAIASRFGSTAMLTARLTPGPIVPPPTVRLPSSPMANMTLKSGPAASSPSGPAPSSSTSTASFIALTPAVLPQWIDDSTTLIVDIRPHAAHSSARIPRAVSLSVPSTLLKRPLFSLQRLSAMLPSSAARNRFSAWRSASRIVVYDADSSNIPDSSNIQGLLKKFKSDGFTGDLAWLQGGFQAVWRERRDLVDTHPPTPDVENEEDEDDQDMTPLQPHHTSVLRTRHLPMSAFSLSSTTVHNSPHFNLAAGPLRPSSALSNRSNNNNPSTLSLSTSSHAAHQAVNPFFDTIRQNLELSQGITERIPLRLPRRVRRRIHELPFAWLQDIARRAAKCPVQHRSPVDSASSASEESEDDEGADPADVEEGTEALAMQFYRIELAEQRRLMGIMEHHSKESGQVVEQTSHPGTTFPFSITAGVEKGAKNRYRHIWPFEHARVRLHQRRESDDDYINASYVQPLGTSKRYIATQGPLPATFVDFWTLCWEQNVHVIVMLTREIEGSMIKCGNYWADSSFGPLRLRLVSTSGVVPPPEEPTFAGFFAPRQPLSSHSYRPHTSRLPHEQEPHTRTQFNHQRRPHHYHKSETVKRVFELSHTSYPDAKPRKIIHLQYLDWPDMNVPDDPRGILGLIREVDGAVQETSVSAESPLPTPGVKRQAGAHMGVMEMDEKTGIAKHAAGKNSPVLLHCSAGVGRTGGFIVVDAVLDAIRREIRAQKHGSSAVQDQPTDAMDIDINPDSHVETAPLPVPSGTQISAPSNESMKRRSLELQGLVVHVPPEASDSEREMSRERSVSAFGPDALTRRWAQNVRDETATRTTPSITASGSSSSEESAFGFSQSHGSYHHPSSSLGTSVSGASHSSSKASWFPSSNNTSGGPPDATESASGTTLPAFIPTAAKPTAGTGIQIERLYASTGTTGIGSSPLASSSTPWLGGEMNASSPMPESAKEARDGELPSRSQSPSADERGSCSPSQSQASTHQASLANHSRAPSKPLAVIPSIPSFEVPSSKTFDYKEPRALHLTYSPPLLGTFDDPISEVVQDMREQRMSLCQSLRQYVFVHAAIIEGALMIVDEESDDTNNKAPITSSIPTNSTSTFSFTFPKVTPQVRHGYSTDDASTSASSSSTGKRGLSPAELLKQEKSGQMMLSKRPSIKRKQRSGDDPDDNTSRTAPFQRAQAQLAAGGGSHRSTSRPS
ncbi:hypothetical protein BDQ12DRAFT_767153 [Crucibulum laeve]|uniref:protein-tyrosine-phosphatase n=1 Tax=Crucibulum laeve TaxID=68775 RepID=A0A5C3M659_9AGAR|nr:hypothetical protein BDQ12DRAFT_767153 [Crucibulum laeve]